MTLLLIVTNDKYELPVAVGSTYSELEEMTGVNKKTIWCGFNSKNTSNVINKKKWKCLKVVG